MIDLVYTFFINGYTYTRKHPQLLMTLLLVIIIPIAFLFSGQQFLNAALYNQERLEKDRIGILHDVFSQLIVLSAPDQAGIQTEIEKIISFNNDIIEFTIAREENNELRIFASSNKDEIGKSVPPDFISRYKTSVMQHSLMFPIAESGIRYWSSTRLVDAGKGDFYYIYTKNSLEEIDRSFALNIKKAYYWLLAILGIVLMLIIRHVRLIDYSYLYSETKKASEMKDLFTNMIAHELRAPLTAMRGYASIIRENTEVSHVKEHAQRIEDSADRLVRIVNDLLDVARMHSGKLAIKNARTNIQSVITSVIDSMQTLAHEKNILLKQETIVRDVFVITDEKRLYQALTNLISNSIKYTKAGEINLALEERSDRIEIRIKDTGMGISAENQKNLFAPFFRVDNSEVEQTVGTGLGMWITKQLIELMKGSIAVESIKGVGTHIIVTLPVS